MVSWLAGRNLNSATISPIAFYLLYTPKLGTQKRRYISKVPRTGPSLPCSSLFLLGFKYGPLFGIVPEFRSIDRFLISALFDFQEILILMVEILHDLI